MEVTCVDGPCDGLAVNVPDDAEPGYEFERDCPTEDGAGTAVARYRLEEGGRASWLGTA